MWDTAPDYLKNKSKYYIRKGVIMWKELFDTRTLKKGEEIQDDRIAFLKVDNTEINAQVLG